METTRKRPPILRALGAQDPPLTIWFQGQEFGRREVYKHDSWAATALYVGTEEKLVCKFNRTQPIFGIPMSWLGRMLAHREANAYQRLMHVQGVPGGNVGVSDGQQEYVTAVAHGFVEGHPLQPGEEVGDAFFSQLKEVLQQVHAEGLAYVDLHKRENVLVGDDGRPHLVDFQISFQTRNKILWRLPPWSWVLRMFQASDEFCLAKHVRNHRPDQLAMLGLQQYTNPPWWIRMHRCVAVPFRQMRRKLLSWIRVRDRNGTATSEQFAEHAFRYVKQG